MSSIGVGHLAQRNMHELSGGERARVMLARALAGEPAVLLADEPVAALDPYHQLGVMELLVTRARSGSAVVVVMHDLTLAARFCDRLVLLDQGRVVGDGPPAAVLSPAALAATYQVEAVVGQHEGALTILPWRRLGDHGDDSARHGKGMP
jgi:iron complex transport system ATP-binding protein